MAIREGDEANVTQLSIDVHTGTHVDAPLHFVEGGAQVEDLGLDPFVGPATVVDVGDKREVDADDLAALRLRPGVERLLVRTINSARADLYTSSFDSGYAALTLEAADWLVRHGIRLIGVDYLSVQRYTDSADVHRSLLGAGIAILEGADLRCIEPGEYELICLPLRLAGVEAAPARAILRPLETAAG